MTSVEEPSDVPVEALHIVKQFQATVHPPEKAKQPPSYNKIETCSQVLVHHQQAHCKPFKCPISSCNNGYSYLRNLKRHILHHHVELWGDVHDLTFDDIQAANTLLNMQRADQ